MTADGQESFLRVSNLRKTYGSGVAVDDVSLDIARGEFVSFLGPSGSGKTTTLQSIAGFIQPDSGQIVLDGKDLTTVPSYRRDIGMVFQNYALFPHMTVSQNIAFPLKMRGTSKVEIADRVATALDRVHLGKFAGRRPATLSGGQQQRVALARAFVFEPSLLLMDEPLGALDKKLRESLQYEISTLTRELGMTVVYVTHDQDEALAMSDRIAVYNEGRLEQVGIGRELYEHPESMFVSRFMGESNSIAGTASFQGQQATITTPVGTFEARTTHRGAELSGSTHDACLVVRPERLSLDEGGAQDSRLPGRVESSTFLGSLFRVQVRLSDDVVVVATTPATASSRTFVPGSTVSVAWHASEATIIPVHAS